MPKISLSKSWTLSDEVTAVRIEEGSKEVLVATASPSKPVQRFSLSGNRKGTLQADGATSHSGLALDTTRDLFLMAGRGMVDPKVTTLTRDGKVESFTCPEFRKLISVAYHPGLDIYIAADAELHRIYHIDPRTRAVVRTIQGLSIGEVEITLDVACVASGAPCTTVGPLDWVTSDWAADIVRVYDPTGACVGHHGGKGSGLLDRPSGVAFLPSGGLAVCDWGNDRIVKVVPEGQGSDGGQETLVDTSQFGLGGPRAITIAKDGTAVVTMFDDVTQGPYNVAVLKGFKC